MVTPIVPRHNLVFILVDLGACAVARYIETEPYVFKVQRAANWEALVADAHDAVVELYGAITGDDHLPCPEELAAWAVWGDELETPGGDDA